MTHFQFDTAEDADTAYYMARDAQILWHKRRQFAQGKIKLNVDPNDECMWTVEECDEMMDRYKKIEDWIYWNNPFDEDVYNSEFNPYRQCDS